MADSAPTVEELHSMIAALTTRLDAQSPPSTWAGEVSKAKALWLLVLLVFTAGTTFAFYQRNIVMRAEFEPVKRAVERLADVPHKVDRIASFLIVRSSCNLHQSTYIRDLADYAAKIRRKPPVMTPAYQACLAKSPSLEK